MTSTRLISTLLSSLTILRVIPPPARTVIGALILLGGMFAPLPDSWSGGTRGEWLDRTHSPVMALVAVLLSVFWQQTRGQSKLAACLYAGCSATMLVIIIELVQPCIGRTASWADLIWGIYGVVCGSLWNTSALIKRGRIRFIVALSALFLGIMPVATWMAQRATAARSADRLFPELLGQETDGVRFLWKAAPPSPEMDLVCDLDISGNVRFDAQERDWSDYAGIEITGELDAKGAVELGVRVDLADESKSRARVGATLPPGQVRLWLPWPSGNHPGPVRQLVIFLPDGQPQARLRLHSVRLFSSTP